MLYKCCINVASMLYKCCKNAVFCDLFLEKNGEYEYFFTSFIILKIKIKMCKIILSVIRSDHSIRSSFF